MKRLGALFIILSLSAGCGIKGIPRPELEPTPPPAPADAGCCQDKR